MNVGIFGVVSLSMVGGGLEMGFLSSWGGGIALRSNACLLCFGDSSVITT